MERLYDDMDIILKRLSDLYQCEVSEDIIEALNRVGNVNVYSAEEVGAALSKISKRVVDDDKFKKPEVEYRTL